jgi:hypothetical protein
MQYQVSDANVHITFMLWKLNTTNLILGDLKKNSKKLILVFFYVCPERSNSQTTDLIWMKLGMANLYKIFSHI